MGGFPSRVCFVLGLLLCITFKMTYFRNEDLPLTNDGREFWKRSIIYQIYPRSFYDANGDGVGDLQGIASKADYFKDLGVETVWLSPIYKSPMADFGYDISDFTDIDPIFGNLQDFDNLIKEMHKRNIKVVLDFVPNHTSDQHKWFQKSLQDDPKYKDYYVWKDPLGYDKTGDPIPPNNWLSVFRYSAWEWSEERHQFYLHQYLKEQPDLNCRNTDVVEDMKNVLRFWLDKGADGFRVDAIARLVEVEDVYGMDETLAVNSGLTDPTLYKYLNNKYTLNQPEIFLIVNGWKKVLDEYHNKLMALEVYDDDVNKLMKYYGNNTYPVSDFPFNFYLITKMKERRSVTGTNLKAIVDLWLENMPKGRWPNWVLGNHDRWRVASRLGVDLVDALNMFILLLPGTPVTYYGEEIGMENAFISFEDTQDPSGCHNGPDHYTKTSRDPERTPMQWDDSAFAGFTRGNKTWLTVHPNYLTINVKNEIETEQSHLKVYQQLAKLRKKNAFLFGKLDFQIATEEVVAFVRHFENEKYIIVINTSEEDNTVDVASGHVKLPLTGTVVIRSSADSRPVTDVGSSLTLSRISLIGGEGMVLEVKER